jgi:hypothetical protein
MLDQQLQSAKHLFDRLSSRHLLRLRLVLFFYVGAVPALAATLLDTTPYPAAAMADGQAWNMLLVDNGRSATIILRPDGTGTITAGLMSRSPTWHAAPDGICIKLGESRPERCVVLQPKPGGFDGMKDGRLVFEIRR